MTPVVVEQRLDKRLFGGEVPVDCSFPDARAGGDIRDQGIQTMLRKHYSCRGQHSFSIFERI
jgi:hypothetical protein